MQLHVVSNMASGTMWTFGSDSQRESDPTCSLLPPPGVYFVVCMALLVISLAETIIIVRLVHKQDLQRPAPDWLKRLVLEKAPVLFCIHTKHRLCSMLSTHSSSSSSSSSSQAASDLERFKEPGYGRGEPGGMIGGVVLF